MTKSSWLEKSGNWYVRSKTVRSLMQIAGTVTLGVTSSLDTALTMKIKEIRADRLRTFFEELDNDKIELTEDIIQTEDFLHAFFATTKAALNTRRREKIQMFARTLKSFANPQNHLNIDEYEDILHILDELSYRELVVLGILEKYENVNPQKGDENLLQRSNRFWCNFKKEASITLNVDENEVNAMLTRLGRTGCYCEITGGFMDYTGGQGYLTHLYFKLEKLILENSNNIDIPG